MSNPPYAYPFDPTGTQAANLIQGERIVLQMPALSGYLFIVPSAAPYFAESMQIIHHPSGRTLVEGVDYSLTHRFHDASLAVAKPIYGSITFMDKTLQGVVELRYQTVGGAWTLDEATILNILSNAVLNPRRTTWEQIVDLPFQFPVIDHQWDLVDMVGASAVVTAIYALRDAVRATGDAAVDDHIADVANPHQVTKTQVGLGNVENFQIASLVEAQAGTATDRYMTPQRVAQAITALLGNAFDAHLDDFANPHLVTATQVGLGDVQNFGIATLQEARDGILNNRYMTPARVKDAIAFQTATTLSHITATDNPHNTTKAQVGLGNVDNFATATVLEARSGLLNNRFMTPALTREAIASQSTGELSAHISDVDNPHQVNKEQVGLALVENFPIASQSEAILGTANNRYMTPLSTRQMFDSLIGTQLTNHINAIDNPHQTTKSQVGLGNVENFPVATQAIAEAGSSGTHYMTALTTRQAMQAFMTSEGAGATIAAHLADLNNPHQVTKAQVGLSNVDNYATADNALAIAGTATNRFVTPAGVKAHVDAGVGAALTAFAARRDNPHVVTAAQVGSYTQAQVDTLLQGKLGETATAADSARLGGREPKDVLVQFRYAAVNPYTQDVMGVPTIFNAGTTWTRLAAFFIPLVEDPLDPMSDLVFQVVGGESRIANESPVYQVRLSLRDFNVFAVEQLAGPVTDIKFGYTFNATTGLVMIWTQNGPRRNPITVTVLGQPRPSFINSGGVQDTPPAGIVYHRTFSYIGANPNSDMEAGELIFGRNARQTDEFEPGTLVEWINVIDSVADVTTAQAMANVMRFDYRDWMASSAYAEKNRLAALTELDDWGYDNAIDAMSYSAASTTLVTNRAGQHYTNYSFEVELSSANQNDGALGVCAAFVRQNGKDFGLYVLRTPGGLVVDSANLPGGDIYKLFSVGINLLQDDAVDIAGTNGNLAWGDGVLHSNRGTIGAYNATPTTGWATNGVCRIRVTRVGDIITIKTSNFGSTDVDAGHTVTVDLASRPELAIFRGPTTWGVCAFDQAQGRFKVINRPDAFQPYVLFQQDANNVDSSTVNRFNGISWTSEPMTIEGRFVKPGRIYYSDINGRMYFARRDGTLRPMYIEAFTRADTTVLTP